MPQFYQTHSPIASAMTALGDALFPDPDKQARALLIQQEMEKNKQQTMDLSTAADARAKYAAAMHALAQGEGAGGLDPNTLGDAFALEAYAPGANVGQNVSQIRAFANPQWDVPTRSVDLNIGGMPFGS